ncbi:MAG: hypothetical protein AAF993_10605 [Pseudomonadota bacterium]
MSENLDIFHTLAEVSVAVTGFSSLIIIFRGSSKPWHAFDYVHFGFVLAWSIGCIFLSLLPVLLVQFGIALQLASQVGLITTVVYIILVGGTLTRVQQTISRQDDTRLARVPRLIMTVLVVSNITMAILAAAQLVPGPIHAWLATAVIALLIIATADLGLFVVQSTREQTASQSEHGT